MGWLSHSIAICTACGTPIEDARFIDERCTRRVDGHRCKGTYRVTRSLRGWTRCGSCDGLGFRGAYQPLCLQHLITMSLTAPFNRKFGNPLGAENASVPRLDVLSLCLH